MAAFQNFRTAVGGFNREDVVHYIEYINKKHASQVNQLKTEIQTLQSELDAIRTQNDAGSDLAAQLEAEQAHSAALQQELSEARAQLESAAQRPQTESELEAYRRAERAERTANERVSQLYSQANAALAEATVRADETATRISGMADCVRAQLAELQEALATGANTIRDTATAMYAIRPIASDE